MHGRPGGSEMHFPPSTFLPPPKRAHFSIMPQSFLRPKERLRSAEQTYRAEWLVMFTLLS